MNDKKSEIKTDNEVSADNISALIAGQKKFQEEIQKLKKEKADLLAALGAVGKI